MRVSSFARAAGIPSSGIPPTARRAPFHARRDRGSRRHPHLQGPGHPPSWRVARLSRRPGPDGKVAHALMTIGPAMIMIETEWPSLPSRVPIPDGSSPVVIFVYVEDVDRTVERAVGRGAQVLVPAQNQFWGDRTAWIMDPSGHVWTIATRIEDTNTQQRDDRWSSILSDRQSD